MQHSIFYYYDANAHLSSLKYPNGWEIAYAPDALGRATEVRVPSGQIFANAITYFPNGAISGFFYGNGVKHTMTQNTRQMPSRSLDVDLDPVTGKTILDDSYVFDENGNVTYITDGAQAGLTSRAMGYDDLDRLIVADSALQWGSATYAYDPLDNIRSADQGPRQYRYNYDAANRLNDIKNPAGATQFTFTYDAQGNTTSKGAQAYVFDSANRLSQVTGVQEYRYDGLGRRVQARDVVPDQTTYWIYSQAGQVLYSSEARRSQNIYYIYLGNTQVATRAVAWGSGTETIRYQHTDSLGSPVAETDSARAVVRRNSYSPYGEAYNSVIDGTGYTGHVMDQATGLTYMQQRYYDPEIGRFMSVDPIGVNSETGVFFNRFSYANNNPFRFTDPDGRKSKSSDEEQPREETDGERRAREKAQRDRVRNTDPMSQNGSRRINRVNLPENEAYALKVVFGQDVSGIEVYEYSQLAKDCDNANAVTVGNAIFLIGSLQDFLASPSSVLEEYFHVLVQWRPGTLTVPRYAVESAKQYLSGNDYYFDNKYEAAAKAYANDPGNIARYKYQRTEGYKWILIYEQNR